MSKYKYERFGVMIDMSRNAVMNVPALKNFISVLKKNGIQLHYALHGGYLRDKG